MADVRAWESNEVGGGACLELRVGDRAGGDLPHLAPEVADAILQEGFLIRSDLGDRGRRIETGQFRCDRLAKPALAIL